MPCDLLRGLRVMQARKLLLPLLLGAASAAPVYVHRDLDSDEKTLVAKGQSFGKTVCLR